MSSDADPVRQQLLYSFILLFVHSLINSFINAFICHLGIQKGGGDSDGLGVSSDADAI